MSSLRSMSWLASLVLVVGLGACGDDKGGGGDVDDAGVRDDGGGGGNGGGNGDCLEFNAPCENADECCSGVCTLDPGGTMSICGSAATECVADGESCGAAADCCDLGCDPDTMSWNLCSSSFNRASVRGTPDSLPPLASSSRRAAF